MRQKAKVVSETNFPVDAGLASSAAGIASLTLAATKAAGLELGERELTILARQGSGSASRSIPGGFVEWFRGQQENGLDSFAESIASKDHWPEFRIIACIVSENKKPVGSRAGMSQTVETCPYYSASVESATRDLDVVRSAIKSRDFQALGSAAELNCLKMHATMMTTNPPLIYWTPQTLEVINAVRSWRKEGIPCYFTIDAGPQVKVLCLENEIKELAEKLESLEGVIRTVSCRPGGGARLVGEHLF
jgi:diphosphomevalonate decarboxylase